jgi:Putative glutamine amidotransferase
MKTQINHIGIDPYLPLPWLLLIAALFVLVCVWGLLHRQRGALWRLLAASAFLALLLNPVLRQEQRQMLPDIGLIVIDGSASMRFDDRGKAAALAAQQLAARATPDLIWRSVVSGGPQRSDVFAAQYRGLAAIAPERRAGSVLITDGLVHDVPSDVQNPDRPINVVIAGKRAVIDRRVRIMAAPAFSIIGQTATVKLKVDDSSTAPVAITLRVTDQPARTLNVTPGQSINVPVQLKRRGKHDISVQVAAKPGDILPSNDVAMVSMQGVRERLNVLLVTGSPSPGARLWRDTLKADSSIDLIHFTILRTPESIDAASNSELALIPFPVEQLFEQRLGSFDLVIFDRYTALDLLQPAYFASVADYVRKGGALLVVTGPEYVGRDSLANTPLQPVLPVAPRSDAPGGAFVPRLSALGLRHPVTQTLQQPWGSWYRYARARPLGGRTLMQTPSGDPLLQINSVGRGRVAVLLSDQLWLWARMDDGGPWNDLVRRTAHWLMKEPDLDSEQLALRMDGQRLIITRRNDSPAASVAQLTRPGGRSEQLPLVATKDGATASVLAAEPGLYQVRSGALERSLNSAAGLPEYQSAQPTETRLAASAKASGGSVQWLEDGLPAITRIKAGESSNHGLALVRNREGRLIGFQERPFLPAWGWLLLLLCALAISWRSDSDKARR